MAVGTNYVARQPLSLSEMIDLPCRVLVFAPIQLVFNLLRAITAIISRGLPVRPFLACAAIRMFLYTFTPAQIQLLRPSTIDVYIAFIRAARARAAHNPGLLAQLREDIVPLPLAPNTTRAHLCWLGDRTTATRFVLLLHGGGFIAPALPGHFEWALQAYVARNNNSSSDASAVAAGGAKGNGADEDEDERVAVAVLQYTLAPAARFPEQMGQAIAALRHLVETMGVAPGQLVVGGDSAGGNLTAQVLAHLVHPHPGLGALPRPLGEAPLAGAFLVSPFVSADTSRRSFADGRACDMLSAGIFTGGPRREMFHVPRTGLRGWLAPNWALRESRAFVEGRRWALPGDAEAAWLAGMGAVVRKVYVTCGRHEILRDQGMAYAESVRARNPEVEVQLEVAEKEAHDFILLEGEAAVVGDATQRMQKWFSRVWSQG